MLENIGNKAQMHSLSDKFLYDLQERKFTADSTVILYHKDDGISFFLEDINPEIE